MTTTNEFTIDEETISKIGLVQSDNPINAQIPPGARIFVYPHLEDVYVMECDLYGNKMPQESCFLAYQGQHGLIGKHLRLETLRNATTADIRKMVERNNEGYQGES